MNHRASHRVFLSASILAILGFGTFAAAHESFPHQIGARTITVKPKFGGQIFQYDIDQHGTEGIFNEAQIESNGDTLSAVETFDQRTGGILSVLSMTNDMEDQFETLGVVGSSVGLVEHDRGNSQGFITRRAYLMLNPLSGNQYTAQWTPPHFNANDIIKGVSVNQQTSTTAFLVLENLGANAKNYVFSSDVATNTFGPFVELTDPNFEPYGSIPAIGIDVKNNIAVISGDSGCQLCNPDVGRIDLATGQTTTFGGVGRGSVNGLAVDSDDGIAVTTTQDDAKVEFYNLKNQTGFAELLPGAQDYQWGQDVEYDPIHKLFLVAQPASSTGPGSSIQIYDPNGNFVESVNNLSFAGYIALSPQFRAGFLNTPNGLQSFTY